MLAWLRHCLSAAYLLSLAPNAGAGPNIAHLAWGLALLASAALSVRMVWRCTAGVCRMAWGAAALVGALSALAVAWQAWGYGALSARVWAASGSGLTLYLLVAAAVGRWPAPRLPARWRVLAPLLLLGAALATRQLWLRLGIDLHPYRGAGFPNPLTAWLDPTVVAIAALAWCWLRAAQSATGNVRRALILALPVLALVWYIATVARHLTAGVTGSDPYAYVQMALDLAQHGSVRHPFPLAGLASDLGLPTWPTVPVGYNPPADGWAATVWPAGWPVMLAGAFRLGGERALLLLAPLCHLGAALLTGLLGLELTCGRNRRARWAVAGLAALLALTSREGVLRSLVPMADAAASLCGAAMFLTLLRASRRNSLRLSLAAGALWGLTYDIRHPQLALGLAGLTLLAAPDLPWRRRLAHVGLFGLGALLLALPDLAYHARTFGSPWRGESDEWFLLSLANIPASWCALWRDGWWRANEWGYLWPFVSAGLWWSWRRRASPRVGVALAGGYGACLLFHLCYGALRLRDLVPIFPWLALLAALGAVRLWERASTRWPRHLQALLGAALALSLAARTGGTLGLPLQREVWTFGYVTRAERDGLASLARLTPDSAVIATGLNAGAVQLYAARDIVRPAAWSADEFAILADELAQQQRPLYVLDDGAELSAWIARRPLHLERVATLVIPRMGLGGQHESGPGVLYRYLR
jgi:hypothetical protein